MKPEKLRISAALLFLALFCLPLPVALADGIGVVDVQKVFDEANIVKEAKKKYAEKNAELQKEISKRQELLNQASSKKEITAKELKEMEDKYLKELDPKKKELEALDAKLSEDVKKEIEAAIKAVAKEQNLSVTLDKRATIDGGLDITEAVIKKINQKS